jgi:hypothetical protein
MNPACGISLATGLYSAVMSWRAFLALADPTDDRKRSILALWMMTLLLGAILLVASGWLLARWRRRYTSDGRTRRTRAIADAWAEAGRRAEPITVDLDPFDEPPKPGDPPERPEQPE